MRVGWGLMYYPLWVLQNIILSNLMKRNRKLCEKLRKQSCDFIKQ